MAERPLLILPTPEQIEPPRGAGGGGPIRKPDRRTQVGRFQPVFQRLRQTLQDNATGGMELRDDPSSLAPDRVIVFEIAGSVDDFVKAASKVPGLEFMAEYDTKEPPDDLFAVEDNRKGREGTAREDKDVPGRFYLAMPTRGAFDELLSLWERWARGERLGRGFTPFEKVFSQLRVLRPWGAEDRILDETIEYWNDEIQRDPTRPVRTEVELWFHQTENQRQEASNRLMEHVNEAGGQIVHEAAISEIAYHGALIDIPAQAVSTLMERRDVHLALADEVMFLRPQSLLINELEPEEIEPQDLEDRTGAPENNLPIAALLDGVPLQGHNLLDQRLSIDDPDNLESLAIVSRRIHGTAMASLILHGDLNAGEAPLHHSLYVRPIMFAQENDNQERTDGGRLVIDTIYRAILRMKGSSGEEAAAPTVFLVNLSIGDVRRPFTRLVSPLARLLDFLSNQYGILFLVSGGNVPEPLRLNHFNTWGDFERASATDRERAVLEALNTVKHERTILSPAEALNVLTIGGQHHDNIVTRSQIPNAVDPFDDHELPNASSALGLGYRRTVKPEIFLPGGREHVRMGSSGGGIELRFGQPQRLYGLSVATPDSSGQGQLGKTALSDGTSSATALATRAAHRIFDALMDRDGGSLLVDMPPEFYAVVVKTLLVHRAQWNGKSDLLKEICGPDDGRRFVERAENVTRFLGFGVPNILEAMECANNRATLVGYGELPPNQAHNYRIPLPSSLERVTDPRALNITLAWFSPVKPGHQSYRCVKLEASPDEPLTALGVERRKGDQPADASVKKGTIFHERYHGNRAVPFIDDGHLSLKVWCKEDAGGIEEAVRYGIAITIESELEIPIYEEIEQRLRVTPRPR
ncbi:MAG: hypothetical protein NPINA01_32120 [Nitrospinaceae bacterium]|jgi:hypothetical protein|nr:MAG: hypothetical protein NPINA01_32120 [Nitrospinaceae bacterium]